MIPSFYYGSGRLTPQTAIDLATTTCTGTLSTETANRIRQSEAHVQEIISREKTVYGVNTGFGILAGAPISAADTRTLQHKILQSHSVLTACQAIEFRRPLKSSALLEYAHDYVRSHVSFAQEDRIFSDDINRITSLIRDFSFVRQCDSFAAQKHMSLNAGFDEFNW